MTQRRRLSSQHLAAAFGFVVAACSQRALLDQQIDAVARSLREVEARGALRCAPRELAVAQSHVEFARLERDRGFPSRAREHLRVSDENVRAAAVLSMPARCPGGTPVAGASE